jgi:phage/plasmid-associated DNA primase
MSEPDDAKAAADRIIRLVTPPEAAATVNDSRPPAFSDESLALRFAEIHTDDLRYVAAWNKWFSWEGTHWAFDATLATWNEARKICRVAAAACNKTKLASALASSKTVAAVISLARSDRRLAATIEQWNTNLWAANTPGGVIDLHTGEMRPHCVTDYMTKITAVAPDRNCPTPLWLAFLKTVTGGDIELIAFLQRMSGYALTGSTEEHALFSITVSVLTARPRSLRRYPAFSATITGPRPSRPSPPHRPNIIRPILPGCMAHAS